MSIKRRFVLSCFFISFLSIALFASGAKESALPDSQAKQVLTIAAKDDWTTFDPFYQISISNRIYNPMLFDSLIKTGNGVYEPGLAKTWEFNDDLSEIIFHLRSGVKFQDGSDFTADDVIWNIDRVRDISAGFHVSDYFADCIGAEKIDDTTVRVKWSVTSHLIEDAFSRLYIICPEKSDSITKSPVGTGPFSLKEWRPGDRAEFVKNDYYWKEGLPYLDAVTLKIISDSQSRVVNLLSRDVDIIDAVDSQDIAIILKNKKMAIHQNNPPEYKNFTMNTAVAPFDNQKVRQAMNYAVDREKVRTLVNSGQGDVRYLPIMENSYFYDEDLSHYYSFDLDKARSLLVEAGYPNGFSFTITVNMGIMGCLEQAQVFQADLEKIGVKAIIEPLESASFFPRLIGKNFEMISYGTGEPILDPGAYFSGAAVARPQRNFFGITENTTWFPTYKRLIEQAEKETNKEVRKVLYHDIMKIMLEQGWTIPITSTVIKVATNNSVENFKMDNTAGEFHLEAVKVTR